MEASVGYWRAKTLDFTDPDVLIEEYAEAGIESLEFDLGYRATDKIKATYAKTFEKRIAELETEETPLAKKVEAKQSERRQTLNERLKRSTIVFCAFAVPTIALLVLTIVIGLKNFTTRTNTYVVPTIVLGACLFVFFIAFVIVTNKWINDFRIRRVNERLSSTEEGKRLIKVREYKELYACLLPKRTEEETEEIEE